MNSAVTPLKVEVTHQYKQNPEVVFDAWLDPAMVGKWMFGPAIRDEQVVSIDIDPKPGGEFSFLVSRQNVVIDHVGSYLRIERPAHLEFNWGVKGMSDSSRVIVKILPNEGGCSLLLVHELHPDWADYFDRAKQGWSQMLDILDKALLES